MKKFIFIALCCLGYSIYAQEIKIDSAKTTLFLDEMVISANKIEEPRRYITQQVEVLTHEKIRQLNAPTTADLLSNSGWVAIQKSQQGGGSAQLRGFEASRVLQSLPDLLVFASATGRLEWIGGSFPATMS